MHLAKKPALRRFWTIDRELRAKSYPTAEQLAKTLEVDVKTIRRDLESLANDYQAPVNFNQQRNGWEYTSETYRLPAVIITEGELVAMFLAGQALQQATGTPYEADLQRAIQKLSEFLPDEVSLHWQALDQAQSFRQSVTAIQDIEIFRKIADATIYHRRLSIRYWTASRNAETERQIDPFHLTCIDGTWYLIAWCHRRRQTLTFATSRIRAAKDTGHEFEPPKDFHVADHFKGAFKVIASKDAPWQTIRLKFNSSSSKFVREKIWHESQHCETHADDSVTLTMVLRSLFEVKRWVLSWGSDCLVLAPDEFRLEIQREAKKIIAQSKVSSGSEVQSSASALSKIREKLNQQPRRKKRTG